MDRQQMWNERRCELSVINKAAVRCSDMSGEYCKLWCGMAFGIFNFIDIPTR